MYMWILYLHVYVCLYMLERFPIMYISLVIFHSSKLELAFLISFVNSVYSHKPLPLTGIWVMSYMPFVTMRQGTAVKLS